MAFQNLREEIEEEFYQLLGSWDDKAMAYAMRGEWHKRRHAEMSRTSIQKKRQDPRFREAERDKRKANRAKQLEYERKYKAANRERLLEQKRAHYHATKHLKGKPVVAKVIKIKRPVGRPRKHWTCTIQDCTKEHACRGMCDAHYKQWQTRQRKAA